MSDFQIVRLKGGHRIHRKLAGESKAICGATYHEVVTKNRRMRHRAGWWIYNDGFDATPVNPRFDFRCKTCFKPPESDADMHARVLRGITYGEWS